MQKYTIVVFLGSIPTGTEFAASQWPLHVTLAPRFAFEWNSDCTAQIKELTHSQKAITAAAQNDIYLGPAKNIHVTKVAPNMNLQLLHKKLVDFLEKGGAIFDEPHYNNDGYLPHVTIRSPTIRAVEGDTIIIDHLAVIDMYPNGDIHNRKVIETINLTQQQGSQSVTAPRTTPHFSGLALFSGRLSVGGYWMGQLYLLLLVLTLIVALAGIGQQFYYLTADPFMSLVTFAIFTGGSVLFIFSLVLLELSLFVRRSHDIAKLGSDDPMLFYFFHGPMLLFGKGDSQTNKYGPPVTSVNPLVVLGLKAPPTKYP